MKIAILLTSNDCSDFAKRFVTDDIKFIELLQPLKPSWQFDCFAVWLDEFPEDIDLYDGAIITGSPASVHDDEAWIHRLLALIRYAHGQEIKVFGCCFGHQAIALALGGVVAKNSKGSWSIGVEKMRFSKKPAFMQSAPDDVKLYSWHKEEVITLPEKAVAIGTNDFCQYPAFMVGKHIFTTQYHPEMTADFLRALTFEVEDEFPKPFLEKARQDFLNGHQGKEYAKILIDFFEDSATKIV